MAYLEKRKFPCIYPFSLILNLYSNRVCFLFHAVAFKSLLYCP